MKKLKVEVIEEYKTYNANTVYELEGDLIILSGVNGSGKSQLLKIISKYGNEPIKRNIIQSNDGNQNIKLEEIVLLSFKDNINIGNAFGSFSVDFHRNYALKAWDFYSDNIKFRDTNHFQNPIKKKKFYNNEFIFDNNGIKNPSWRSIKVLMENLKEKFQDDEIFNLEKEQFIQSLPLNFIWRNENDIVSQVGNIFYMACCKRVDEQLKCAKSTEIFDNSKWLKNAPWTQLNELFSYLKFKYRFKEDYEFNTPYMEETPVLRDGNEIRTLNDLSDGEKSILKLALLSLDEEISNDFKLVLFDEYDAPLNPSLTEAFYYVINKFYIEKGIQVIITTHSPATISLAPAYAHFYEIFNETKESPKIIEVNQFDYLEIKEANEAFYNKIKDQDSRIKELESLTKISGNMLLVEDKYDQIYKIAYLKNKDIDDLTEDNLDEKFKQNANFVIHGGYSTGGLYNVLNCMNISRDIGSKIVCLFDFDGEGYKTFKKIGDLKKGDDKLFLSLEGNIRDGLYRKHCEINKYAMILPIPERLEKYVSKKHSTFCFIEVESLISEEYLKENSKAEIASELFNFYKMKDDHKKDFWKDLLSIDKKYFEDFRPLFNRLEMFINDTNS